MLAKINRFRPRLAQQRVADRADDSWLGDCPAVNDGSGVDRAKCLCALEHCTGESRAIGRVEFVKIKTLRLPVLVNGYDEVEIRLSLEPADVVANFTRDGPFVIAVEIELGLIFAGAVNKANRIDQWAEKPRATIVKKAGFQ